MKGKVTLLAAEEVVEGKLYITKIDGVQTAVIARENLGEGFFSVKVANNTTIKVVKSSNLNLPVIELATKVVMPGVGRTTAVEVRKEQFPIAIICLDGREVEYEFARNGADITKYSADTLKTDGVKSSDSIKTAIDKAITAERERVIQILKDVQSSTMGGMKLIGADPMHAQVSFDIAINKVKNGEEASLVPETLEKLYDKLGIKSDGAKAVTLNALLDSFVANMKANTKS